MTRTGLALAVVALVVLGACSQPPLTLSFDVAQAGEDVCSTSTGTTATSCSDVALPCRSVVSIRIYSPDDETSPYISVCKELTGQPNLCAIAGVDLPDPQEPIPDQTLEVDIVVFPFSSVTVDPVSGDLQCPTGVAFDANGFPVDADEPCTATPDMECPPDPAIGGRAYYHPGDSQTVVKLGCVDISQVDNPSCSGGSTVDVTASVDDFDTDVAVQPALADDLNVWVGEPKAMTVGTDTEYVLDSADAFPLARTVSGPVPGWGDEVAATFTTPCLEVLEDGAETTATVACGQLPANAPTDSLDMVGWRLAKASLDQILAALGASTFPDSGLVVGLVLDPLGNALANQTVAALGATVMYLSGDRSTLVSGATTSSGIFVSTDAKFGTTFSVASGVQAANGFGGLVAGKVTIVVLQYQNPVQD
ncbi:MAG TPA: hypothetical protein VGL61_08355 [Kofleriaceae bacterium]